MSGLINYNGFSLADTPSLKDKVCVITGGQGGFGKDITAQLLVHDISKVYVLSRSAEKFEKAKDYWKSDFKLSEDDIANRVRFVQCDLSDMKMVKTVGDNLVKEVERLDILIDNAGLPTVPDYWLSPQGIEAIFATNVVGHFELTQILSQKIQDTAENYGDARIVVTSSSLHMGCQELKFDLLTSPTRVKSPDSIDSVWRYSRSKLGTILLTRELARRLDKMGASKVYVNCFFPGNVPTEAMDTWKDLFGTVAGTAMKTAFRFVGQSATQAATTAIYLAASPEVVIKAQKGKYFVPIGTEDKTSEIAEDKDLARNLWYWCDDKVTRALGKGWEEGKSVDIFNP